MKTTVNTIVKASCIITEIRSQYGGFDMVSKAYSDNTFNEMISAKFWFRSTEFAFEREYTASENIGDIRDSIQAISGGWYALEYSFDDLANELHERADMLEFFSYIMDYLHQLREGEIMS